MTRMERDFHSVVRQQRIRERQREVAGSNRFEVTFQVPISGEANTAIGMQSTDYLDFGVGFMPRAGEDGHTQTPAFRAGFSIIPTGTDRNPKDPLGLVGFANCPYFYQNGDGLFIGAFCHIGVVNLGEDQEAIPYEGFVSLSFMGHALQGPIDQTPEEYEGPNSGLTRLD